MRRIVVAWVVCVGQAVAAQEDGGELLTAAEDAGVVLVAPPAAAVVDAGVPAPPVTSFDVAATPWGPGRKSSGEAFRSAASAVDDGPLRWKWNDFSAAFGLQYFARVEGRDNADLSDTARDFAMFIEHRARVTGRVSAFGRVGAVLPADLELVWR